MFTNKKDYERFVEDIDISVYDTFKDFIMVKDYKRSIFHDGEIYGFAVDYKNADSARICFEIPSVEEER
jgi:hypothetical protein